MKKLFLALSLFICAFSLFAQDDMEPEFVVSGDARIVLNSGEEITGQGKFTFKTPSRVMLTKEGQKRKKIKMKEIKEFFINDIHFVKIITPGITIGSKGVVAMQKTPIGYKIPIYETVSHSSDFIVGFDGKNRYKTDRNIYIHFPEMKGPRSINDITFIPFDKKISKQVASCAELSQKIANKEEGYSVSMLAPPEMRFEILLRISDEFQRCQ